MTKQEILDAIEEFVTTNGLQQISGQILNLILTAIANIIPDDTMLTSSFGGIVSPNTNIVVVPNQQKWFFANVGTYANYGGLVFDSGKLNILSYNGTIWQKFEVDLPTGTVSPEFDPNDAVRPQGGKQIENRFGKLRSILKYFLEQPTGVESLNLTYNFQQTNNNPIYGIVFQQNRILRANNTLVTFSQSATLNVVFKDILLLQGSKKISKIILDVLPFGNNSGETNATVVGVKSDGTITPLVMYSSSPAPTTLQHYELDVSQYQSVSIALYISSTIPESLNQVIKFFTKSADGDTDGVKKFIESEIKLHTPYLDLIDFGCAGDGITDDTAAFNSAIIQLINNGGGTLFGRDRKFKVSSITIPDVPKWLKIEIAGSGIPVHRFGTIGSFPVDGNIGTMQIISDLNNNQRGVINVNPGTFDGWNLVFLSLRNLAIRTYNNPNCWGVNAHVANQLSMENIAIDTGVYNVQASDPTNGSIGILTPRNSNGAFNTLRNVSVSGMTYGIQVQEHTLGDQIILSSCKHGLYFRFGSHASLFGRVNSQRNTNHISVATDPISGQNFVCKFSIQQLNMEYTGAGQTDANNAWQSTLYELNDPNNGAIADIKYTNVKGAQGGVETFRFNGGSRANVKQIGSDTRLTSSIIAP